MKKLFKNFVAFAFVMILMSCNNGGSSAAKNENDSSDQLREKIVDDIKNVLLLKLNNHEEQLDSIKKTDITQTEKISQLEKEIATIKKKIDKKDKDFEARISAIENKQFSDNEPNESDFDSIVRKEIEKVLEADENNNKPISKNEKFVLYPIFLDAGNGKVSSLELKKSCAYKVEKVGFRHAVAKNSDPIISFVLSDFDFNASENDISKKIFKSLDEFSKQYGRAAMAFVFTGTSSGLKNEKFLENLFGAIEKSIPQARLIFPNYGNLSIAKKIAKEKNINLIIANDLIEHSSNCEEKLRKCMDNNNEKSIILISSTEKNISSFNNFVRNNNIKTEGILYY